MKAGIAPLEKVSGGLVRCATFWDRLIDLDRVINGSSIIDHLAHGYIIIVVVEPNEID